MNWILFYEQFNFVQSNSGFEQVGNDQEYKTHVKNDMPVDNNGFLYIYVSNETPNIDVFFDNLQVTQIRGPILEETHYYPFGLTMAGICSKAAGKTENKDKTFQGQKFDDDLGIDYDEFKWRNHDPQIGRFIEIDPLSADYEYNSTYAFSEDKVTTHVELEGLEASWIGDLWNATVETVKQLGTAAYGLVGGAVNTVSFGLVSSDPFNLGNNLSDPLLKNILSTSTDIGKVIPFVPGEGVPRTSEPMPELIPVEATPTSSRPAESPVTNTKVESNSKSSSTNSANKSGSQNQVKLSKVEKSTTTESIGNGKFTKTTEVRPGRGPGQSRAEYTRYKNQDGKVIKNVKDSYDRANKFQGRKVKELPNNK